MGTCRGQRKERAGGAEDRGCGWTGSHLPPRRQAATGLAKRGTTESRRGQATATPLPPGAHLCLQMSHQVQVPVRLQARIHQVRRARPLAPPCGAHEGHLSHPRSGPSLGPPQSHFKGLPSHLLLPFLLTTMWPWRWSLSSVRAPGLAWRGQKQRILTLPVVSTGHPGSFSANRAVGGRSDAGTCRDTEGVYPSPQRALAVLHPRDKARPGHSGTGPTRGRTLLCWAPPPGPWAHWSRRPPGQPRAGVWAGEGRCLGVRPPHGVFPP